MKKIIKKIWGIGLVVVLMTSLFITAAPASAADFAYLFDFAQPAGPGFDTILAPAGFGVLDVAQSGDTIYAVGNSGAGANLDMLYKSTNGGATWVAATAAGLLNAAATNVWGLVAVAPDDPNFVVVVDTLAPGGFDDTVWLSTNGGALFQRLTGNAAADLNAVAVSPSNGTTRYIAIGGHSAAPAAGAPADAVLQSWTSGAVVTGWTLPGLVALPLALDDIDALAYSPNFLADQALMVVTETVGSGVVIGNVSLRVFSYNTNAWDAAVDVSFPRVLETTAAAAVLTCGRADITLDANFFLGDESLQIGFIGAQIFTPVATEVGGVYLTGAYTVIAGASYLNQIMTGIAINSVAWDGTNLLAGQLGGPPVVVWRCANALSIMPLFLQNSTVKAPGTGNNPIVLWSGTDALAFSQGNNSAVAKSADLGKSFNGIALINSNFATIRDIWVSPDGGTIYLVAQDGTDTNLWRKNGWTYERVMILAGHIARLWMVRADSENPATVFLGEQVTKNMYYSLDSGNTAWTVRSCSQNIQDFAVQDKDVVYVAVNAAQTVVKTSNGGFTWGLPVNTMLATGGNCNSLTLLGDSKLLVGGNAGGVTFSKDGAATFAATGPTFLGGAILATATGLEAGDTIWAVSAAGGSSVSSFVIGTDFTFTNGSAAVANGIAYSNGVLYVLRDAAGFVDRFLYPTIFIGAATDSKAEAGAYAISVNNLHVSTAGATTTLWSANAGVLDSLDSFTDTLTSASTVPTPTYPINNAKIAVNSINGAVAGFVFQWNRPDVVTGPPPVAFAYAVQVYLDEAGTIPIAGSAVAASVGANIFPTQACGSAGLAAPIFAGVPGTTYYWRVRVFANTPVESLWSPMQTFTVQQLTAIVPTVSSPEIGASINNVSPAFSWTPISGVTSYKFELSANAAFVSFVYEAEVLSAGAQLPSVMTLERGKQYFWRVKALAPSEGEWSTVANFVVAEEEAPAPPPVVIEQTPAPVINIPAPPPATVIEIPPQPAQEVIAPAYIWAIIIIGGVLVIAVIVLIVRTRRSV